MSRNIDFQDVARDIMSKHRFKATNDTKTLYIYKSKLGIYTERAKTLVEEEAQVLLGEDSKDYLIKEVLTFIINANYVDREQFDSSKNLVNVKNGILNIETREIMPHSPEHLFLNQIPIIYNPDAECPAINKFLSEIVGEIHQKLLRQIIGYLLVNHYYYHHQFFFVGNGKNGKTTLMKLLKTFIGEKNVVSISMQELCSNIFISAELYGKKANLHDDLSRMSIKEYGKLKQLTGESNITAQRKHKDPFQFNNIAKMIFACNEIPDAENADDAYFDRCVIIPFEQTFIDGENADKYLFGKLTKEKELSGLLNIALDGLQTIREDEKLDCIHDSSEIRRQFQLYLRGSIPDYARARIVSDADSYISKIDLYKDYLEFQEGREESFYAENTFSLKIRNLLHLKDQYKKVGEKQQNIWLGIKVKKI